MPEEKLNTNEPAGEKGDYEAPAIEEVVSPEGLDREVAYAGVVAGPSQISN